MRTPLAVAALALVLAAPLRAQTFMGDVHRDLNDAQKKFIDLANAIPESAYAWHPNGARSIGEVLMHVAADNYYMPIPMGKPAPAATGVKEDYNTAMAFEKKKRTKAEIVAELTASFKHLHASLPATDDGLNDQVKMFGQTFTRRKAVLATVADMHEHLGQLIAYARSNNVVPPWSK